jgi:pilus assembly protein CpaB
MTNKRNVFVLLVLAAVFGLGAALLAQHWAEQRMDAAQEQASSKLTQVIVAAQDIEFGKRIEPGAIKSVNWPVDVVPPGTYHDPAQVIGKQSKYHIMTGEPILEPRLADPDKSPLLAGLIEPNKRAVSVRVDDVVGVGGFLLPGSRVDVLASRRLDDDKYETRTILHHLKVLAVDQTASAGGEDKPVVVRAVTLEADPQQAEALVQATREGTVQLALRNPDDQTIPAVAEVPKPAPPPVQRRSSGNQITVIRGTHTNSAETRQ